MEKELGLGRKFFGLAAGLACLLSLCGCAMQKYWEVETLDIRANKTLKLFFKTPVIPSNTILVLFFGANGRAAVPNILSRTIPIFLEKGVPVVIVDEPLQILSLRATPEHLEDIRKVVEYVGDRGFHSIYLVGTSNGTISVAHAGSHLRDERIKGLVLSGTQSYYIIKHVPFAQTPYPVLFIHHKLDECPHNSHQDALRMSQKYLNSPRVDFVTVNGGGTEQPCACCDMTYHDFWKRENEFVQTIVEWVLGKEVPKEID